MPRRKSSLSLNGKKHGTNNSKQARLRNRRARQAAVVEQRRAAFEEAATEPPDELEQELESPAVIVHRDAKQEARQRDGYIYWYAKMGDTPTELWHGHRGTLRTIFDRMELKPDASGHRDYRPIQVVLERFLNDEPLKYHGGGQAPKLSHGEALVAADCIERGTGREQAAHIITARRKAKGVYSEKEAPVSAQAVRGAFKRLDGVTQKRGTTSTGSRDVESPWATSSLAQCEQFKSTIVVPSPQTLPQLLAAKYQCSGQGKGTLDPANRQQSFEACLLVVGDVDGLSVHAAVCACRIERRLDTCEDSFVGGRWECDRNGSVTAVNGRSQ